jgi:thiol-disulfide isomerase/thioredoxin
VTNARDRQGMPRAVAALIATMTPGLIALIAALVVALAGGAVWRRTNGRMRTMAAGPEAAPAEVADPSPVLTGTQLGHELGERATLVQFSSAFCAPCRATRQILADVAAMTQGVAHVEIDAESRLDLVRQLNVLRTPTVLVLAADGRIVRRASGQPRKPDVIAAIGAAVGV